MNEQILPALVGALGTVSVTAVGALAWMVRRQHSNGSSENSPLHTHIDRLNATLLTQTQVLTDMSAMLKVHTAEAALRHTILETLIADLKKQR